jgi:Cysteine-rich CPXCG
MTFDDSGDPFEPNGDYDGDADARLDEDFPLGDGTAETEATVACPYCAAAVVIAIDPGGGSVQEYVEDCDVCCQPWVVSLTYRDGLASVTVRQLDG